MLAQPVICLVEQSRFGWKRPGFETKSGRQGKLGWTDLLRDRSVSFVSIVETAKALVQSPEKAAKSDPTQKSKMVAIDDGPKVNSRSGGDDGSWHRNVSKASFERLEFPCERGRMVGVQRGVGGDEKCGDCSPKRCGGGCDTRIGPIGPPTRMAL